MSSYLDVREPNHQLSSVGSALASVSDPGVVEPRCCAVGAEVYCGVGCKCSYYLQVVGTLMATRDFVSLFFSLSCSFLLYSFLGQSCFQAHWQP